MRFWKKALLCVAGGIGTIVAAPVVIPIVASTGIGAAIVTTATAVGTAVASSSVGAAVIGTVSTAGTAIASSSAGAAVIGTVSTAGTAIAGAGTAVVSTAAAVTGLETATILTGAAAATIGSSATYSVSTAGEGFCNTLEADSAINSAKQEYELKRKQLDNKIKDTTEKIVNLNKLKMYIYSKDIQNSIDIIKQIKMPREREIDYLDNKKIIYLDEQEIQNMKATALKAGEVMKEVSKGVSFVKAAATGAVGFMTQFGIASTGTAISTLSGAAATNATLAAFGGGAIAAGGGGMALGSFVLGGITILPATMIMSWNYLKHSEKYLTEAKRICSEINKEKEKNISATKLLEQGIDKRIDEINNCMQNMLSIYRSKVFPGLKKAYDLNKDNYGKVDFKKCSKNDQDNIKLTFHFVKNFKEIIAVKVLDGNGKPSEESRYVLNNILNDSIIQGR